MVNDTPVRAIRQGRSTARPRRMSLRNVRDAMRHMRTKRPNMTDAQYRELCASFFQFAAQRHASRISDKTPDTVAHGRDQLLTCPTCGHAEAWSDGGYSGERVDFEHHMCGHPGHYRMCGPYCAHEFPGCSSMPGHPTFRTWTDRSGHDTSRMIRSEAPGDASAA